MPDFLADSRKLSFWRAVLRLPLHLPRLLWRILILGFFVMGVGLLLLRYLAAPQIAAHRADIEQALTQQLGLKVQIAELDANWSGLRPELSIHGLRVFDREDRVALELPELLVSVAWASVWHRQLILDKLEIRHPELSMRRTREGDLFIAGLQIKQQAGGDSAFGNFVLGQHQILIRDARLVWADEQRAAPELTLDHVNFRLENSGRSHRFAIMASPPAQYSANLDIRGDLLGQGFEHLDQWKGTFYLSLDDADLAVWQQWLDYPLAIPRGRGGLRTWLSFDGKHVDSLTADVALAGVSLQFSKALPVLDLASLQGRINLTAGENEIRFAATNLSLATQDGVRLGPTRVGLDYRMGDATHPAKGSFSSGELDLRVLAQLAAYMPLPDVASKRLTEAAPAGRIVEVKLGWQGDAEHLQRFEVDAELKALRFNPVGDLPGAEGLDARIKGSERGGQFSFQIQDGAVRVPADLREATVPLAKFALDGRWGYEKIKEVPKELLTLHIDALHLANPHIPALDLAGYWQDRPEGPGFLDLRAQARRALLEHAWRYIPASTVDYVPDWLHQSLQAGFAEDLKFQLTGDLAHFPFNKSPGVFKLEMRLTDARLDTFAQGWPGVRAGQGNLLIDRQRLSIHLDKGFYQGALLHDVKVEIPDLMDDGKQVLTVDGRANGTTQDFLAYVNASHLAEIAGPFTRDIRAQGNGDLRLHIEVPLHESRNTRVKGDYHYAANTIKLIPALPEFTEAGGTLDFTEKGLSLNGADGVFLGKRLRAVGVTEADGAFRVDVTGAASVVGLRKLLPYRFWAHLQGESPVSVLVRAHKASTDIIVDSNFAGIASDLPAPLGKLAVERWPVRVSLHLDGHDGVPEGMTESWRIKLDSRLDLGWVEQCRDTQCSVLRGAVSVGEEAVMPQKGWRISGAAKSVDVAQWQPLIAELLTDVGADTATPDDSQSAANDIAVVARVDELRAGGYRFTTLSGKALHHAGQWSLHLDGPDIAGDILWKDSDGGSLHARLTQLSLQNDVPDPVSGRVTTPNAEACQASKPPALDLEADSFRLGRMNLGKLTLAAVSEGEHWMLNTIALSAPDMSLKGSGSWQCSSGTWLAFKLNSDNAGSMLGHFGLPNSVRKGKVEFAGNLAWQGVPSELDFASLSGALKLKANDGQFTELEPGAGRLLGILSLQSLPRRLMGNIDDVIAKGFAFDSITGNMHVTAGVLYTDDLEVRGPAGRVFITGSTDLGREAHNLNMRVQPTMSDPVAIGVVTGQAIAGIANPVLGLSLYLGQKVLRDPVEKIFSYELEVTGPWADPKVEKKAERIEERLDLKPNPGTFVSEPKAAVSVPAGAVSH